MKDFIVFNPASGEVVRSGSCLDCDFESQGADLGFPVIEGSGSALTHYVSDGILCAYPEEVKEIKLNPLVGAIAWSNQTFSWIFPAAKTGDELLVAVKSLKWSDIKKHRSEEELKPLWFDGDYFDADLFSQQRISGAVQLALLSGDEFQIEWTLADNSSRVLSKAELIILGVALGSRTAQIFQYSQALREQIELAQSVEDVEQIGWQFNQ